MLSFPRSVEHVLRRHKHGRMRRAMPRRILSMVVASDDLGYKKAVREGRVSAWLVGVDTGGTFTALFAGERAPGMRGRARFPSVPHDPSFGFLHALENLFADGINPADISMFVHGTTVATNALLEGKGVR